MSWESDGSDRSSSIACLLAVSLAHPADAAGAELSLTEAVRQTLEANLDLAAQRQALAADREQVSIARSALLPQVNLGARAQHLDDDRSDAARGNTSQNSATVAAGVTQVLYDENAWAGFDIQKHVYDSQRSQFETLRLSVIQDAANAFLQLDSAREVLSIQEGNRELTRKNLETSRARVAAGYSGERDVLRWQSQLAGNDGAVVQARTLVLVNRFELNRVRNQAPEVAVEAAPVRVEEYGFVYARDAIARALANPDDDRRLRDLMVREGLSRSPVLAQIDASIAAQERQLQASRRAFWVPSASLGAGINHMVADQSDGGSSESFNDTEWTVGAELSFPLVQGGAKFARFRQARETLSSLRIQRRSQALEHRGEHPRRLRAGERLLCEPGLCPTGGVVGPAQLRAGERLLCGRSRLDRRSARRPEPASRRTARGLERALRLPHRPDRSGAGDGVLPLSRARARGEGVPRPRSSGSSQAGPRLERHPIQETMS